MENEIYKEIVSIRESAYNVKQNQRVYNCVYTDMHLVFNIILNGAHIDFSPTVHST